MVSDEPDSKKANAAYVPFATFCTALDHLKSHGIPQKIDASVFPNMSGGLTSHLLLSMRFLGLIDEHGRPQPTLDLVVTPEDRKAALSAVIQNAYSQLFQRFDLAKASPTQIDDAFRDLGMRGATARKAKAFLIKAAKFSGIPISNHLLKRMRSAGLRRNGVKRSRTEPELTVKEPVTSAAKFAKTVRLPQAAGAITLTADFDPFSLRGAEREFFYKLVDQCGEFEQSVTGASE